MNERVNHNEYFYDIACAVASRGTCLRRIYGSVIVRDGSILSTGYCGSPRGAANCCEVGSCRRDEAGALPGERYELCVSVHSEMNAVINAARNGVSVVGGKLYLYGWDCHKKVDTVDIVPCKLCSRVLVNAGIVEVIYNGADGFKSLFVDDLLRLGEAI